MSIQRYRFVDGWCDVQRVEDPDGDYVLYANYEKDLVKQTERADFAWKNTRAIDAEREKQYQELVKERARNAALQAQVDAFYAGNPEGGIVQRLETELESIRAERDLLQSEKGPDAGYWGRTATLAIQELKRVRAELDTLRAELAALRDRAYVTAQEVHDIDVGVRDV